jgi:predicted metal-dependent peptidase
MKLSAQDKLSKAIIALQTQQPFFAYLLMRSKATQNNGIETMGVDAKGVLYYNSAFVDSLSDSEVQGVLCHEMCHVFLEHLARLGHRDKELSNISMDVAVNMIVKKSGLVLPECAIPVNQSRDTSEIKLNGQLIKIRNISDKTWEEIYAELMKFKQQQHNESNQQTSEDGSNGENSNGEDNQSNQRTSKDSGGESKTNQLSGNTSKPFDNHIFGELTPEERAEIQSTLTSAAIHAKQRGTLPGGMDRIIDGLLKPQISWRKHLLQYVKPFLNPVDWSYQRPSKKSKALEVFLPSTIKESVELEAVIDTSGSISSSELSEFLTEIVAIKRASSHVALTINFADTKICARYEIKSENPSQIMSLQAKGGGGTQLENALDEIKAKTKTTSLVVVLTDGCDCYSKTKKDYPFDVLWVVSKAGVSYDDMRQNVKYGSIIKINQC